MSGVWRHVARPRWAILLGFALALFGLALLYLTGVLVSPALALGAMVGAGAVVLLTLVGLNERRDRIVLGRSPFRAIVGRDIGDPRRLLYQVSTRVIDAVDGRNWYRMTVKLTVLFVLGAPIALFVLDSLLLFYLLLIPAAVAMYVDQKTMGRRIYRDTPPGVWAYGSIALPPLLLLYIYKRFELRHQRQWRLRR